MQLVIKIGDSDQTLLVLDAAWAAEAAVFVRSAKVFEREGWSSPAAYKPSDKGLNLSFVDDTLFTPEDPKVAALKKERDEAQSEKWSLRTEKDKATKEIAELKAKLEAIQSVTTCTVKEPEAPKVDDNGVPF